MPTPLTFEILHQSSDCHARLGRLTTPHGTVETPAFMPVGTQASVKGLTPNLVRGMGADAILVNTYHLMLRPGSDLVAEMGGLHRWMGWPGTIITDSGGFQVFSLADLRRIGDEGVTFRSHIDGASVTLTAARSIQAQNALGADIIMAFDDCPPASEAGDAVQAARVQDACERSLRWLGQSIAAHQRRDDQALFGIVQGGTDLERRAWCAKRVVEHDLPGYAIGGVAVGEGFEALCRVVAHTAPLLPATRPRYLMGVGYERDMLAAVRAGVDLFDCVLPTRNGRNANAFTREGAMRLRNARFARDERPLDPTCDCPVCAPASDCAVGRLGPFSRSYLRHLFMAGEMLGPMLVSLHNIRHFQRFMLDIRRAIAHNDWSLATAGP